MNIVPGYLLRRIIDNWVVVPVGENVVKTGSMFSLSESSALLWKALEHGSDETALAALLCENYHVDEERARRDVGRFLQSLREAGALSEES